MKTISSKYETIESRINKRIVVKDMGFITPCHIWKGNTVKETKIMNNQTEMLKETFALVEENQNIMNRLIEMNATLMIRLAMANSFRFIAPNGEPDPNSAIGYRIQDPNEPDKHFSDEEPETDVKWFWVIRCSGSMFMDAHGNYNIPKNIRVITKRNTEQKMGGSTLIASSDLPLFETIEEMFTAYNTYWMKRM